MAINTIEYGTLFQSNLDKLAVQEAVTGWMDGNAGQVVYNGGAEVKVPMMSVDGLGNYDRDDGFPQGGVSVSYQTLTMTQDRGRKFQLDAMDVNESNFVATASNAMGEFQRTKVVPEIDAYRLSKIAAKAIEKGENVAYGYVPAAETILKELKLGIKAIRDKGYTDALVIHASNDVVFELEMALSNKIQAMDFSVGGIVTKVPSIDNVPIIPTPAQRMYSSITIYDGVSEGQKAGGYVKGENALDVNFLIMPKKTPIAVTKQDKMRIFDPNTYQKADAWSLDYRRYHELWILKNKEDSIYANFKDAQPAG